MSHSVCFCHQLFIFLVIENETEKEDEKSPSKRANNKAATVSSQETEWRGKACDYEKRFCGHCNTTTDIKEANFFGR